MPNTEDLHRVVLQREQYAVIAESLAERTSHVAVKRQNLATAGARKISRPSKIRMAVA